MKRYWFLWVRLRLMIFLFLCLFSFFFWFFRDCIGWLGVVIWLVLQRNIYFIIWIFIVYLLCLGSLECLFSFGFFLWIDFVEVFFGPYGCFLFGFVLTIFIYSISNYNYKNFNNGILNLTPPPPPLKLTIIF